MNDDLRKLADAGALFLLCHPRTKKPIGEGWQHAPHHLDAAIMHLHTGGNVGLLAGELSNWLIALDLDKRANHFCTQYASPCAWRIWRDNAPERAKYIVRCPAAHNQKDLAAGLEVLAFGNAVVADVHETSASIRLELRGDVPELPVEELGAIFSAWTGKPYGKPGRASRLKGFAPVDIAPAGAVFSIRMLLDHIAPWRADDYNEWIRVGHAVKHECGLGGFEVWNAWSRTSTKYDADECRARWESLRPDGRATLRTLRYLAQTDDQP